MGGYESKEYERLVARNFKDYSLGHRRMYTRAIEQIAAKGKRSRVLEAGFGIGWGLRQMGQAGILESYIGFEPNFDSFKYTVGQVDKWPGIPVSTNFLRKPFEPLEPGAFDDVFCIEVIEHVDMGKHENFLADLGAMLAPGGTLWLSTPDKDKAPKEGVRTTGEWSDMMHAAGFAEVVIDTREWTHLYRCREWSRPS